METVRGFFESTAPSRLEPSLLPDDVVVVFHIDGPGGGSWQVRSHEGGSAEVGPVATGPKDCTVTCSEGAFLDILSGAISPQRAFLSGRVKVWGDVGLVLRLAGLLGPRSQGATAPEL